jgi:hypothetical protein
MPDEYKVDRTRPVCRSLRTKGLYVYGPDSADLYRTSRSCSYRCARTSRVTGPDDAPCVPESCQPGRDCFESR